MADGMNAERRSSPNGPRRRVRWDRIALILAIIAVALAFWAAFVTVALRQLTGD
jgi:hypothetical protein